jgi:hypothetical protein
MAIFSAFDTYLVAANTSGLLSGFSNRHDISCDLDSTNGFAPKGTCFVLEPYYTKFSHYDFYWKSTGFFCFRGESTERDYL